MDWIRVNNSFADSDKGYRILFIRRGAGWYYMAYGPKHPVTAEMLQVQYQIGEAVPVGREYVGGYHDPDQAKQACVDHWGAMNECGDAAAG